MSSPPFTFEDLVVELKQFSDTYTSMHWTEAYRQRINGVIPGNYNTPDSPTLSITDPDMIDMSNELVALEEDLDELNEQINIMSEN